MSTSVHNFDKVGREWKHQCGLESRRVLSDRLAEVAASDPLSILQATLTQA